MLALRFMSSFLGKKILTAKPVQFEGVMPSSLREENTHSQTGPVLRGHANSI
jgi:hypothetical protein